MDMSRVDGPAMDMDMDASTEVGDFQKGLVRMGKKMETTIC